MERAERFAASSTVVGLCRPIERVGRPGDDRVDPRIDLLDPVEASLDGLDG
jgi:hypothetical protein